MLTNLDLVIHLQTASSIEVIEPVISENGAKAYFEVTPEVGGAEYILELFNKDYDKELDFQLKMVNDIGITKLFFGEHIDGRVIEKKYRIYQIDAGVEGIVDIRLAQCLGRVILYTTTNR